MHRSAGLCSIGLFSLLVAQVSAAFDTPEHEWISNRAFCAARHAAREPSAAVVQAMEVIEKHAQKCKEGKSEKTVSANYGELVAFADFAKRPEEALTFRGKELGRIDVCQMEKDRTVGLRWVGEVLVNEHHFGRSALAEFHSIHEISIERAARGDEDSIIDALAMNAHADHFLEDFLAPGHVAETAQDKSHMENRRLHVRDNAIGRIFEVNPDFWAARISGPLGESAEAMAGCFTEEEESVKEAFKAMVIARPAWRSGDHVGQPQPPFPDRLKGDGDVLDEKGVIGGSEDQAALMVLLVTRSVLDVLEAATKEPEDTGPVGAAVARPAEQRPINSFPNHRCPVGEEKPRGENDHGDSCYYADLDDRRKEYFAGFAAGHYRYEEVTSPRSDWPPVIGVSAELQRISGTSRVQFSPEAIFALDRTLPWGFEDWRPEVGLGYSIIARAHDYDGHGPDVHLYLRNKGIYTFLAADLGYRFYSGLEQHVNGVRVGGRIGIGNGLLWGYFGVSRDLMIEEAGKDTDTTTWSLGVAATFTPELLCQLCN